MLISVDKNDIDGTKSEEVEKDNEKQAQEEEAQSTVQKVITRIDELSVPKHK